MNNTQTQLNEIVNQLSSASIDLQPDARLIITIDTNQNIPGIVIEQTFAGERIFVQNAHKDRLCRASYVRDGGPGK